MPQALILPEALRHEIGAFAAAAFPEECCGLIEGTRSGETVIALALHPTANLAAAQDRFEIDPAAHIALLRSLRGTGRSIVGCYHSHPGGPAQPSPRDREGAADERFVWLIQAVSEAGPGELAAFVFETGDFRPLAI